MVIQWDFIGIQWDFMVIQWDIIGIQWDFIGVQWDIHGIYPLVMTNIAIEHGPVKIVDLPIKKCYFS